MKHGSIDWLTLLISLNSLIFIVSGATWCVSPKSFVKVCCPFIFQKTDQIITGFSAGEFQVQVNAESRL